MKPMEKLQKIAMWFSVSPLYPFMQFAKTVLRKLHLTESCAGRWLNSKRVRCLETWFAKQFGAIVDGYAESSETAVPFTADSDKTIWACWLQGVESMPQTLKTNLERIHKLNPGYTVRCLDLSSACELIEVPPVIMERFHKGMLSPAHLVDYIRVALLERYGGIWMDLTLFQIAPTPDDVLSYPMYSVKGLKPFEFSQYIPDGTQWQIYYLGAQPHALFYKVFKKMIESYIEKYKYSVDYFFMYYLAALARSVPAVEKGYEKVPDNNTHCEMIMDVVLENIPLENASLQKLCSKDTWIYKTSNHLNEVQEKRLKNITDWLDETSDSALVSKGGF